MGLGARGLEGGGLLGHAVAYGADLAFGLGALGVQLEAGDLARPVLPLEIAQALAQVGDALRFIPALPMPALGAGEGLSAGAHRRARFGGGHAGLGRRRFIRVSHGSSCP